MLVPLNAGTGLSTTIFGWSGSIDTGVGLSGYQFQLASDIGFSSIINDSIVSLTGKTVTGLTLGTKYWRVRSFDQLGNMSAYSSIYSFDVTGDVTSPTATVVYSTTGVTSGNVVATVTGFSEAITGLNATQNTFSANGSFTFTFQDLAGNYGSATANVTWIDTIAPTASVSYFVSGGNTYSLLTGESETITGLNNSGQRARLFDFVNVFTYSFRDLAGNPGSASTNVGFTGAVNATGNFT